MSFEQDPTLKRPSSGPPAVDLPEGLDVGEYRVQGKIGEGGMGSVYAAIHPVIGKRVAIKVLAPQIAAHPELVRRFIDEARAVNKIGHPNIVDIFSFGWLADQRHYFVMEYLEGQSLADRMKRGAERPIDRIEARRLLGQICGALEAAHQAGIVHRDLKPDNIWVAQPKHGDSFAKLLDFGIAKLMVESETTAKTQTGAIMGTPAYMAPEQCRGVGVESRTDIYALGVILYEMFTGRTPFQGTFVELITQHLSSVPEAPSLLRAMSKPLERLILRCLEKDPARRPATAAALGHELAAVLAEESALPPQETEAATADTFAPLPGKTNPGATLIPARDKRPWLWIGGAGLAAVIVAALAVSTGKRPPPRSPPPPSSPSPSSFASSDSALAPSGATDSTGAGLGRIRVVAPNADNARFFIDGRLVASGGREADVAGVVAAEPHLLRVEADGWQSSERRFTVAAAGLVEMQVALARPGPPVVAPAPAAEHPGAAHTGAPRARGPAAPAHPSPAAPGGRAPRHRDGLVGDDIFDAPAKP